MNTKPKLLVDLLLDASGSMGPHILTTISAVKEYVASLENKRTRVSVTAFDSDGGRIFLRYNRLLNGVKPKDFDLTSREYFSGGMTPLYDAMARLINERLHEFTNDKTDRVLVVFTDGLENCSQEFTAPLLKGKIDEWRARGWLIMYLGANQDAILESSKFGMTQHDSLSLNMAHVGGAMNAAAGKTMRYVHAGGGVAGMSASVFLDEERKGAVGDDDTSDKG